MLCVLFPRWSGPQSFGSKSKGGPGVLPERRTAIATYLSEARWFRMDFLAGSTRFLYAGILAPVESVS